MIASVWLSALACGACSDKGSVNAATNKMPVKVLQASSSGYIGDVANWENFLLCWSGTVRTRPVRPDIEPTTVLSKYTILANDPAPTTEGTKIAIQNAERRLDVVLPRSYKHFLEAYRSPQFRPHEAAGGGTLHVGMYAPEQIGSLGTQFPEGVREDEKWPVNSPDDVYFRYGVRQDEVSGRTAYRRNAIVVGSHGHATHDLIVLYPQQRTADGEMEAALLFHAGEFRAPSFAELMRQLSYMETHDVDRVPPYSQSLLKGTCADKLPLTNVWWE